MPTLVVFHEVDDVEHWLSSPKREEFLGPLGMSVRTFVDPEGSTRVGVIVEVPDIAAFQEAMESEAAAEAMKFDGVRPDTVLVLTGGLVKGRLPRQPRRTRAHPTHRCGGYQAPPARGPPHRARQSTKTFP